MECVRLHLYLKNIPNKILKTNEIIFKKLKFRQHRNVQTFKVNEKVISHALILFLHNSPAKTIRFQIVVKKYFDAADNFS